MEKITNYNELENHLKELDKQGFYISNKSRDLHERKLEKIISEYNEHNIDLTKYDLKREYESISKDYIQFANAICEFMKQFSKDDKLLEIANRLRPQRKEHKDRSSKTRTIEIKKDKLKLLAHYQYQKLNDLFFYMWYAEYSNTIGLRMSQYNNNEPTKWWSGIIIKWDKKVFYKCFKNGNIELTGDIEEFNELYVKLWEKLNKENEGEEYKKEYIVLSSNK